MPVVEHIFIVNSPKVLRAVTDMIVWEQLSQNNALPFYTIELSNPLVNTESWL